MGRAILVAVLCVLAFWQGWKGESEQPPPPDPTLTTLQRQNAALRDSLEAERGWDTTPPGFIREICEVQNE